MSADVKSCASKLEALLGREYGPLPEVLPNTPEAKFQYGKRLYGNGPLGWLKSFVLKKYNTPGSFYVWERHVIFQGDFGDEGKSEFSLLHELTHGYTAKRAPGLVNDNNAYLEAAKFWKPLKPAELEKALLFAYIVEGLADYAAISIHKKESTPQDKKWGLSYENNFKTAFQSDVKELSEINRLAWAMPYESILDHGATIAKALWDECALPYVSKNKHGMSTEILKVLHDAKYLYGYFSMRQYLKGTPEPIGDRVDALITSPPATFAELEERCGA